MIPTERIETSTPSPTAGLQRLRYELTVRHIANVFIMASIIIVLGTTLYPFDFTEEGFQKRLTLFLASAGNNLREAEDDITTNIILFLPLGFGFAVLANRKKVHWLAGILLATFAGGVLSLAVELLQLYLPFRHSSFLDVASNAAGTSVGFLLYTLAHHPLYVWLLRAVDEANRGNTRRWIVTLYFVYLLCSLLASIPLQQSSFIHELDTRSYPLTIGNEPTGVRPWNGSIKNVLFTKHALSDEGVAAYLADRPLNEYDRRMILAHYEFNGGAPYKDSTGLHPPLEWMGDTTHLQAADRAFINPNHWLQTNGPAMRISSNIGLTSRFSICATVGAQKTYQPIHARIISVSSSPYQQNLSVIQVYDDLAIRYRSMTTGRNGTNPQFMVPNVFADTLLHRIVVTFNSTSLSVYIDSVQRAYDVQIGPGFALFNKFLPSSQLFDLSSKTKEHQNLLFNALVFVPLGYLLALFVLRLQQRIATRILIACVGIAIPVYLLERVLMKHGYRPMNTENLFIALAFMGGTVILTLVSNRMRRKAFNSKPLSLPT